MDRLLRLSEVESVVGFKKSSLYSFIAAQRFPAPVRVGRSSVRWRESDITAWMQQLGVRIASYFAERLALTRKD